MTKPAPTYAVAVNSARRDHIIAELNDLEAAVRRVRECNNRFYARYVTGWNNMSEPEQNAMFADVRDFRLRLDALASCGED